MDLESVGTYLSEFRRTVKACNLSNIPRYIDRIIKEELWRDRVEGYPKVFYHCESLAEFITDKPVKGMGWQLDDIKTLLRKAGNEEVALLFRKATTAPIGTNQHSDPITTLPSVRGTSKAYLLGRLKEEKHQQAYEAWQRGEFKSLTSAARAAGIIKAKTPLEKLLTLWQKSTEQDRAAFLRQIGR